MPAPVAIRLDKMTRQRIARIAHTRRTTASQVMREAIETGLQSQEVKLSPYELMAGMIGVVHGGDPRGSEDMGRKFAAALKNRARRS